MNLSNIRVLNDSLILAEADRIRKEIHALAEYAEFAKFCMTAKDVLRYLPKEYTLRQGVEGLATVRYLLGKDFDEIMPEDVEDAIFYYPLDSDDCGVASSEEVLA